MASRTLETRAAARCRDLRQDANLTAEVDALLADGAPLPPWLGCYRAMLARLAGDADSALTFAQAAAAEFACRRDLDGHARAVAEAAIAAYLLGRFAWGLAETRACPAPADPSCAAALYLADFLNHLGLDELDAAIEAGERGLRVIESEPKAARRVAWETVLRRNLAAAYHFRGDLPAARQALDAALRLATRQRQNPYLYTWTLSEYGLLLARAGDLDEALSTLRRARARVERDGPREPLACWIAAAEGRVLRDMGRLDEAEACYQRGGWGEGDEGPLMLWLLQGKHTEARCAADAAQSAALASASPVVATNLRVFMALLDLERGATPEIRAALADAAARYAALGFRQSHASVLLHLAAVEYALGDEAAGDQALAEALGFGAATGYLNFDWWHPARMWMLLRRARDAGIEPAYTARLLAARGLAGPAAPASLDIRSLGRFAVRIDGRTLPPERWRAQRAGALRMQRMLLFLARRREPQPLEGIARYVWADRPGEIDLSANFHLTLAGLRRVLEPELAPGGTSTFVLTTEHGYQLNPALASTVDLDEFLDAARRGQAALAHGDNAAARAAFTAAERRYTGDFALAKPPSAEADDYRQVYADAVHWLLADDLRHGAAEACIARAR